MSPLGRSQDAYDRFSSAVEVPMTVLALLWLPVLVIPAIAHVSKAASSALDTVDYLVWAVFAAEYLIKLYLAPLRWRFVRGHLIYLLVIAIPVFRPLRVLRLLRFARTGLTLTELLSRARSLLTHRGLHFVLLSVLTIILVGAALEFGFEDHARG